MQVISPPSARTAASVEAAPSTDRSQPTTRAPSAQNIDAAVTPMPPPTPVIRATLPASRPAGLEARCARTSTTEGRRPVEELDEVALGIGDVGHAHTRFGRGAG